MAANDAMLAEEMTRVQKVGPCLVIESAMPTWTREHEPSVSWVAVLKLSLDSTAARTDTDRLKLVKNRKFFSLCRECRERRIKDDMHNARICTRCAENNHGVLH